MATQLPLNHFSGAIFAGSDLLPSFSTAVSTPWKFLRGVKRQASGHGKNTGFASQHSVERLQNAPSRVTLPECLGSVSLNSLRGASPEILSSASSKYYSMPQDHSLGRLTGLFGGGTLQRTNNRVDSLPTKPPSRLAFLSPLSSRSFSTSAPLRYSKLSKFPSGQRIIPPQRRLLSTGSLSRVEQNVLSRLERNANSHPQSAPHQESFYDSLIASDLPKIVIERYNSGRYATNEKIEALYLKALRMTGAVPGSSVAESYNGGQGLNQETLQTVGQAVAAQSTGGYVGSVSGKNKSGTGAKEAPLYVVVEESYGSLIFRWVRLILTFGLISYVVLVSLTMLVEATGGLRSRIAQNNEVQPQQQTVRFADVHGCEEAKEEVQELVEFLKNPERFNTLGGKLPKGVLLVGPPGTGKTLLAKAVAGEAGCPFFYMSGSEFDELYVGVGAKRVRDLFAQARNKAPAIIFIDELDAVGTKRNARDPAYAKQTLNQLLTELDGFSPSTGIVLIAATNYPQALDKALTRPGRFDRWITVDLPDVRGRVAILKHHMRNIQVATDVDASIIARGTPGFSGADLENLVNQAAVRASRLKQKKVGILDFEWAKDRILMGAENRSRIIQDKDKIMTAYHEAGHALVSLCTPGSIPLHKMTILPRGHSLGVTYSLPEMDVVSQSYNEYIAQIDRALGGRAAEELIYGPDRVSSGCTQDLQSATHTAMALITQMGYSKKLGAVDLDSDYDNLSSETKREIEGEVRTIINGASERATKILTENRTVLEALKDAVLEHETLTREEMETIFKGGKLDKPKPNPNPNRESSNDDNSSTDEADDTKGGNKSSSKDNSKGGKFKLPDVLMPPGMGGGSTSTSTSTAEGGKR